MKKENQSQPAEEVQEKDNRRSNRSMGILTVDASGVLAERDTGDTAWHELVNAYRTKKILSGDLGGIERLEGGWVVAVVYYKGCRILIPMEEMMINLEGDGREPSDPPCQQYAWSAVGLYDPGYGRKNSECGCVQKGSHAQKKTAVLSASAGFAAHDCSGTDSGSQSDSGGSKGGAFGGLWRGVFLESAGHDLGVAVRCQ